MPIRHKKRKKGLIFGQGSPPVPRTSRESHHGNLMSYKTYVRPAAHRLYGDGTDITTKHQDEVRDILRIMFLHGACTTWEMAKMRHHDMETVRAVEKSYRRLLVGRQDMGRYSAGLMSLGLVLREEKKTGKAMAYRYRLSLHGILYCIDVMDFSHKEIDAMASIYSAVLPLVFGMWKQLRTALGNDAHKLAILSKAILFDSAPADGQDNPLYGIMSFIHAKYTRGTESISERGLAEQVSCWFYTFLLYPHMRSKKTTARARKARQFLADNPDLKHWYAGFFGQAADHYESLARAIREPGR